MFLLIFALVLTAGAGQTPWRTQTQPKRVEVFDGKTFAGWEGDLAIFRIQDGAIVGGSLERRVARNEFLCTTKTYGDFELRLKVKLLGGEGANAGIQFRTRRIPNHHEVSGYQADIVTPMRLPRELSGSTLDLIGAFVQRKTAAGPQPACVWAG